MRRKPPGFAALAIAGLTVACHSIQPSVVPQSVRVWGADISGVIVRTDMDVYNPNRFSLNVAAVSGTITLANQVPLGSATVPTASHLPGHGWQHVTADMKLPWLNLPAAMTLAGTQTMVPYTFDGSASIGGKLRVTIPFRIQGEVPAAELMRAGMRFPFGVSTYPAPSPLGVLALGQRTTPLAEADGITTLLAAGRGPR